MKQLSNLKYAVLVAVFTAMSFSITSCSDDDDNNPKVNTEAKEVKFEAQSFTEWTYFSFEKGAIVTVSDASNDTDWDMGFLRFNIRTNGGTSGKGKGAAIETTAKDFDKLTTIPSSGFVNDSEIKVMVSGAMPSQYTTTAGSTVFKVGDNQGWAWFDFRANVWSVNNNVFIIRTATGKYAKVLMKSFLNDADKSGHITFEYIYIRSNNTSSC